jgi:hypothetical protein
VFFAELRSIIRSHVADVANIFQPLDDAALMWRPNPKEWSILICFDHLNQTYNYYQAKIERALAAPFLVEANEDNYRPSVWGGIYMFFALNPRMSFPTPAALMPTLSPERAALEQYLTKQQELLHLLSQLDRVDLARTRIPIEKSVAFNLGDCLKILVYHDSLHIRQARNVLAGYHSL